MPGVFLFGWDRDDKIDKVSQFKVFDMLTPEELQLIREELQRIFDERSTFKFKDASRSTQTVALQKSDDPQNNNI